MTRHVALPPDEKVRKTYVREKREPGMIPTYVRAWRLYRGFATQSDLARAAGMASQVVSRLERGTQAYTYATLSDLARVLHCREGDLISYSPPGRADVLDAFLGGSWPAGMVAAGPIQTLHVTYGTPTGRG